MAEIRKEMPCENVPVYEFVDVNSKEFHIGTFRKLWVDVLNPEMYSYSGTAPEIEDVELIEEMGIEPAILEELKNICSVDSLRSKHEDQDIIPSESHLSTLKLRKRRQDYKETLTRDMVDRHEVYANEMEMLSVGKRPDNVRDLIPEGEVILTFNIMYPILFQRFRLVRAFQTLHVLGSQKLTDLRDVICCVSDLQVFGEFSNTPDMVPQFISKDHYKSAFFFFNGTFYNDTRFPECQDISKVIKEWTRSRDFPDFKTARMEDTSFNDLQMKVGFPYLYTHQGDCEHVVVLTDVRLVHQDDCLDIKLYPLITHKHRVMTRKCSVCHLYISRWITTNDALAPMDPCLFCDQCFRMFHYDDKGNKVGDFLAYAYVDPGTFN
ncbi:snRNA-activating protein complex subunit 3 [Danio rerio]|uniref:snRNA-activating protein complex subunit 3 n=1 Tax=Danio rerio TaxID=7955 RepID=Q7ZU76_DANRE|nr:snRNA-activating protein complex subunit 3 [Danio rerio]AAH50516.1 Zgc:56295 [Danio rerio]|eukprot:NP_957409.1 snRNA-activating protein complex subunit 3 [Danio rerio]